MGAVIALVVGSLAAGAAGARGVPATAPANLANTWLPTSPMSALRSGATATLLPDGEVLVAGGGSASADLYDPASRTFTPTGSMSAARTNATATMLPDGEVLIVGGRSGGRQLASADLYDVGAGTFTPTMPMQTARSGQTATLLPDGDVLVAGGGCNPGHGDCDASSFLDTLRTAELYHPGTATWTDTTPMAVGRQFATATLLTDGTVLVAGGFSSCDDDICKDTKSTQIYDPATSSWNTTGRLLKPRQQHTATMLQNGDVLVAGGTIVNGDMGRSTPLAEAELYDPGTGRWTTTPSMGQPHSQASASLLSNGWVLVAGGQTSAAQVYEPDRGIWVTTGEMNTHRTNSTATVLASGDVLVAGGGVNTAETYQVGKGPLAVLTPPALRFGAQEVGTTSLAHTFTLTNDGDGALHVAGLALAGADPGDFRATDNCPTAVPPLGSCTVSVQFKPRATGARSTTVKVVDDAPGTPQLERASGYGNGPNIWAPTGSMASGRDNFAMTRLHSGKVLVAGGQGDGFQDIATAELYDPKTRAFTPTGSMTTPRSYVTATVLRDGDVLVAGGDNAGIAQSSVDLYDPTTGTWSATSPMHESGYGLTSTLLRNGNVLVTGLGAGSGAEVYDPHTAQWTDTGSAIGTGRFATATLLPDGRVLVAGGGSTASGLYNPAKNTWTAAGSMKTSRFAAQAVLLHNGMVLVAGGAVPASGAPLATAELYDAATNAWTFTQNTMYEPRKFFTLTLMNDGNVLAAGGCGDAYCGSPTLDTSQIYNTAAGFWEPNANMVHARAAAEAAVLPSGDLLVAGGHDGDTLARSAETFTPVLLSVTPTSGPVGQRIILRGNGFQAFEMVKISWEFTPWTRTRTSAQGRFSVVLHIPQADPGIHAISTFGTKSFSNPSCTFTVTAQQRGGSAAGRP